MATVGISPGCWSLKDARNAVMGGDWPTTPMKPLKAILAYGYLSISFTGNTNSSAKINTQGDLETMSASAGTARAYGAGCSYGGDKGIMGLGSAGSAVNITNLVSNLGVIAGDNSGVGTARSYSAAASYGTDKGIFGFGYTSAAAYVSVTNLVSNAGVLATDTSNSNATRYGPGAVSYGQDKAMFGYGYSSSSVNITTISKVSNAGVLASDETGVGTARSFPAAVPYSDGLGMFVSGGASSNRYRLVNKISYEGNVLTDEYIVNRGRYLATGVGYGGDKGFIYGGDLYIGYSDFYTKISNLGIFSSDTFGPYSSYGRYGGMATGYSFSA